MTLSPVTKARLRLAVVYVSLVPVALIARALYSDKLTEFVRRAGTQAWRRYDATRAAIEEQP